MGGCCVADSLGCNDNEVPKMSNDLSPEAVLIKALEQIAGGLRDGQSCAKLASQKLREYRASPPPHILLDRFTAMADDNEHDWMKWRNLARDAVVLLGQPSPPPPTVDLVQVLRSDAQFCADRLGMFGGDNPDYGSVSRRMKKAIQAQPLHETSGGQS